MMSPFSVAPGRVTGFLAPNGAGKSTTMEVLLDLACADAGYATIGGSRYRDLEDPLRTVGVVLVACQATWQRWSVGVVQQQFAAEATPSGCEFASAPKRHGALPRHGITKYVVGTLLGEGT